jgi:hypothetical protein
VRAAPQQQNLIFMSDETESTGDHLVTVFALGYALIFAAHDALLKRDE